MRIRNIGGASEIPGFATTDCPAHAGLHVAGDHFVIQACDPVTGREVPDGERGTLVVSAFGIDALFLRYDLQDIVVVSRGPCECGETGPRYTLLGRRADAVQIDGRMLLPLDVHLALEDIDADGRLSSNSSPAATGATAAPRRGRRRPRRPSWPVRSARRSACRRTSRPCRSAACPGRASNPVASPRRLPIWAAASSQTAVSPPSSKNERRLPRSPHGQERRRDGVSWALLVGREVAATVSR